MNYLLDTDTCIFILRERPPEVRQRLENVGFAVVGLSAISAYELRYGAEKHPHPIKAREKLRRFQLPFQVLPWDEMAAIEAARIRTQLEKQGEMIGPYDVQIAAHARCLGLTLVTGNVGEFRRVQGLKIENWLT